MKKVFLTLLFVLAVSLGTFAQTVVYATDFTGADLGAKINAAASSLPNSVVLPASASGGSGGGGTGPSPTPLGIVMLPDGAYDFSTPIEIDSPNVILRGQHTTLRYTGTGNVAILINDSPTSYEGWGGLEDVTIYPGPQVEGHDPATATAIEIRESTWTRLKDVRISGFTSGVGLLLHNTSRWIEQTDLYNVRIENSAIGIKVYKASTADSISGFYYQRWRGVFVSVPANGTGVLLDAASVHGIFEVAFFLGNNSKAVHLTNGSVSQWGSNWTIRGEMMLTDGSISANGLVTDSGTTFVGNRDNRWWNSPYITDSFASGTYQSYIACNYGTTACMSEDPSGIRLYHGGPTSAGSVIWNTSNLWHHRTQYFPDTDGTNVVAVNGGGKMVSGTGTIGGGGTVAVTFPGGFAFSGTSYTCTTMDTWATDGSRAYSYTTTGITVQGTATHVVSYICIGD